MTIIKLLSSSQGKKGNEANLELVKQISVTGNRNAVDELVENLSNKDKNIQSDCIKTLYELGYIKPELIADYCTEFIKLLSSKNNRLVWGGMIALATIADLRHKEIFAALKEIVEVINKGSVITIDNGVEILTKLNKHDRYFNTTDPLLIDQLWKCPIKQFPMYIEKSIKSINKKNKEIYATIIEKRKQECEKDTQIRRLDKSLKEINKH